MSDSHYLTQALHQAQPRRGFCSPNPSVGAVIVRDNQILSTGYHLQAGAPHAEREALQSLLSREALGATLYVTLEPCCHWGKTPPCTEAIIQSGLSRVVYAYRDPNPAVSGRGERQLREAGIICEHISLPQIDQFYESYHYWWTTKKPFVTAKIAMSLDGKIAGLNGEPIRLTGTIADAFTHVQRKKSDAILTTVKTILQDNPQLNARSERSLFSKPIYILDRQLRFPLTARVIQTAQSITLFHGPLRDNDQKDMLEKKGLRCISLSDRSDVLDLDEAISFIGQEGIHDLWIEAGGTCFASFSNQSLLQRAFIYVAPRWLGKGQAAFPADFDLQAKTIHWKSLGEDALCEVRW